MTDALITLIKCLAAVLAGIFAGNGAVYFFNKMPAAWLTDYGEKPSEELLDPYTTCSLPPRGPAFSGCFLRPP